MRVLILFYWEGETVINCIMFTCTCKSVAICVNPQGMQGQYCSWDIHPPSCFVGGRKCLVHSLELGDGMRLVLSPSL